MGTGATILLIAIGSWFAIWLILNMPRRRPDGDLVTKIHPYRKMIPYMWEGGDASVVYYDDYVKADALLDFIKRSRENSHVDMIHCLVAAVAKGLQENPKMNQFIAGNRLYVRNHAAITFSMKRQKMNKEAKLSAVKMFFEPGESFEELCERINGNITVERSEKETYTDKELGIMTRLPRPVLRFCIKFVKWVDYYSLLPWGFIKNDAFYSSVFIANLGSLGMRAAYHHLYDYGNCPLFLMVGRVEDRPVVVDGKVVPQKTLHLRYSYDERIDDGLTSKYGMQTVREVLEDPDTFLAGSPGI